MLGVAWKELYSPLPKESEPISPLCDELSRKTGVFRPYSSTMSSFSSFRDPAGFCFARDGRIFRAVSPEALTEIDPFLRSDTIRGLSARRMLIPARRLSASEQEELLSAADVGEILRGRSMGTIFEHEKVEFVSYPFEWVPEMLYEAGRLTLDLAQTSLQEGYCLKDATPYNVLFEGSTPVFVDLLSFERRNPRDPVWRAHAQFCRTFLLPLLAHKYWGVRPVDIFSSRRDGLEPSEVYRFCGPLRRFVPLLLTQVSLPTWLSRKAGAKSLYRDRLLSSPEKARFILDSLLKRLRRSLQSVQPRRAANTVWSDYMDSHRYAEPAFTAKESFVDRFLKDERPRRVLDVGSNTGHFSILASRGGAKVVAIDSDLACISLLWQRAHSEHLDILPLVVDVSRPSAAKGWRYRECASFLERAAQAFDAVLMLAILHHLLITERVPLDEVLDLAAEMTTRWLVIEYVSPDDDMFQLLTRGRDHLYGDLTKEAFEAACRRRFRRVRTQELEGTHRTLYLLEKAM